MRPEKAPTPGGGNRPHGNALQPYWIIDLDERKLTLLVRDGTTWVEQVLKGDQPIPSLVLPGLVATVADLWVDLEEYEDDAPTG